MEFAEVIQSRSSIRDFLSREISNKVLEDIVKEAQFSPSWANSQPWKVYIAKGKLG